MLHGAAPAALRGGALLAGVLVCYSPPSPLSHREDVACLVLFEGRTAKQAGAETGHLPDTVKTWVYRYKQKRQLVHVPRQPPPPILAPAPSPWRWLVPAAALTLAAGVGVGYALARHGSRG